MDRYEFFARLPRSEPGAVAFTSAYLSFVQIQRSDRVLDLRCGSGERTIWIARSRGCKIVSVDQDPRFCRTAAALASDGGASDQVTVVHARYDDLPFEDESFALVIAEWAPVDLGLDRALRLWQRLVPVGGHLAISYPGVINRDAPSEVRAPLEQRMVEPMRTLADYQTVVRDAGYELIHQAPLNHGAWDNFYTDVTRRAWAINGHDTTEASGVIREFLDEARWYRRIGRGRVFLQSMLLRRTQ